MSRAATIWGVGAAISLAVHAAVLVGIVVSVKPDRVEPQKAPKAKMQMSSYEVPRARADAGRITGEKAAQDEARGTALSQDAIPRVAALARRPEAAPAGQPPIEGQPLPQAANNIGVAVPVTSPPSATAQNVVALAARATETQPPSGEVNVSEPAGQRVPEALPRPAAIAGVRPGSTSVPEAAANPGVAVPVISPPSATAQNVAALVASAATETHPPSGEVSVSEPAGQRVPEALPRPAAIADTRPGSTSVPEAADNSGVAVPVISPPSATAQNVAALAARAATEAQPPSGEVSVSEPAGQRVPEARPRPAAIADTRPGSTSVPEAADNSGVAVPVISPPSATAQNVAALAARAATETQPPSGEVSVSEPAGQRVPEARPHPARLASSDASVRVGSASLPAQKTIDRAQSYSTSLDGQPMPAESVAGEAPKAPPAAIVVSNAAAVVAMTEVSATGRPATPVRPDRDEASAVAADTVSVSAGIFELPEAQPLPASRTGAEAVVLQASFQGAEVSEAVTGIAEPAVAVSQPDRVALAGLRPPSAPADSRRPPADPAAAKTPAAAPAAERAAPSTDAAEESPASVASSLPPRVPPSQHATAALAWTGGSQERFDPVSLAAIQSFMTDSDLSTSKSSAGSVRDGIASLLSSVPCARLQVAFVPETGSLELRGHVPEEGFRAPVLASLRARIGGSIPVVDNLLILPHPQCNSLSGIAGVGLPQSTDQLTNPLLIGRDAHAKLFRYSKGQRLIFDMTAPDYPAYVYVDYFDAEGNVIHLVPNDTVTLEHHEARSVVKIGADRADGNFLAIMIGPPFGQEIAVAFAASEPLYDGVRPTVEPAVGYLQWLKDRVSDARAADPDFKGEWVYFFVSTTENPSAQTN